MKAMEVRYNPIKYAVLALLYLDSRLKILITYSSFSSYLEAGKIKMCAFIRSRRKKENLPNAVLQQFKIHL